MRCVLLALGLALVLATALPLLRTGAWTVRVFDFPRVHILVGLAALFLAYLFMYRAGSLVDNLLLAALAASVAYQVYRIYPYTPLAACQVVGVMDADPDARIRLLIANVLMENRRVRDLLAIVRAEEPDLVMTVESDSWWDERLAPLVETYPHRIRHPLDNTYGMHLFSRLELVAPVVRFLVEDDVPSIRTGLRLKNGTVVQFYGLHPRPPRPGQDTEERDAELLLVAREVARRDGPSIVAGDLNDVAWSHTTRLFQRLSGSLDPRIGRGIYGTFHARYPMLRWPLDHVFIDDSFTLGAMRRLSYFGSDHFPVLAELYHHPAAAALQEAPAPENGDRAEAAEKIEKGRQSAG